MALRSMRFVEALPLLLLVACSKKEPPPPERTAPWPATQSSTRQEVAAQRVKYVVDRKSVV